MRAPEPLGAVLFNTLGCKPADWISTIASSGQSGTTQSFRSRPDLQPPTVGVNVRASDGVAPGYVFVAVKKGEGQDGPMIMDNQGRLVWFSKDRYATDFKVQTYKGEPVLTWWQGGIVAGHGEGEYVIFDSSYREVRRVKAGNGYKGDLHEFSITPQDTALLTVYTETRTDLSPIGGPKNGPVWDGIAQELDLETGEVLFEWHSLDHVGVEESYRGPPEDPEEPLDYFHINSIEVEPDGNFLIDAKGTYAVYKVDRESGEVLWRLGGKRSDFEMERAPGPSPSTTPAARRRHHHHLRQRRPAGGARPVARDRGRPRHGRDEGHPGAGVHPSRRSTLHLPGQHQVLPNGNVFIGGGPNRSTPSTAKTASCSSTSSSRARPSLTGPSACRGADARPKTPPSRPRRARETK